MYQEDCMRDIGISNDNIYEKYQEVMNESTKGYRRKVQLLDDRIDNLIDDIEKKITKEEDNPTYQRQLYQMVANMNKEHNEFIMSIKRVASTIDGGSKTIPQTKGQANPNHMQGYQEDPPAIAPGQEQPGGQETPPDNSNVNELIKFSKDVIIKANKNETKTQQNIRSLAAWLKDLYELVGYGNKTMAIQAIENIGKAIPSIKKIMIKDMK